MDFPLNEFVSQFQATHRGYLPAGSALAPQPWVLLVTVLGLAIVRALGFRDAVIAAGGNNVLLWVDKRAVRTAIEALVESAAPDPGDRCHDRAMPQLGGAVWVCCRRGIYSLRASACGTRPLS